MDNDIDKLVKASIETKILEAIRSTPEYIDDLVRASINQEVDQYGKQPDYHSRERQPYLTFLVKQQLQCLARDAVREIIGERRDDIIAAVREKLSGDLVATAITGALSEKLKDDWRIDVEFRAEDHDE